MLQGGKSGPALVPGKPEKSLILQKILAKEMPPLGVFDSGVTRPPEPDVEKLKQWIARELRKRKSSRTLPVPSPIPWSVIKTGSFGRSSLRGRSQCLPSNTTIAYATRLTPSFSTSWKPRG